MSGGKGKSQTIGYHYLFSILFGIGRGPIDELVQIKVGDKIAWVGAASDQTVQAINAPNLFGGEKKEGGIQGLFRLFQGESTQVLPGAASQSLGSSGPNASATLPAVKSLITSETGGLMGELRGRVTVWFDGLVASMNPYIKAWKFRVRRTMNGWHLDTTWYPAKATIWLAGGAIKAMNPAHMIYECCTNAAWARGAPVSRIDENSFIEAANKLCSEAFGLCLVWYRREDIDQFVQSILDHIGGVLFTDRETGKIALKLVRDDYVVDDLPLFTPETGLLDVIEDDTGSSDTTFNEVIVTGHDPVNDEKIQMRSHNIAAFRASGAPATLDQPYKGLPTKELCGRVAQRDLRANAAGLRKFKVVLDRRGFRIHPGAVFRIAHPKRKIGQIVLRAGEIDDGKMIDGKITISTVQDVFGLPDTTFVTPVENSWSAPPDIALPVETQRILEANYRQAYLSEGAAEAENIPEGDSYMLTLAARPSQRTLSHTMLSRAEGETEWRETGEHYFSGTATLAAAISATATVFTVDNIESFPPDSIVGQALLVGDEYMKIADWDADTGTFTVVRGVIDTWPVAHASGDRVWLADDDPAADDRLYTEGEVVEAKLLPATFADVLDEADATLIEAEMNGRIARPYPPADVQVDGDSIYGLSGSYIEPTLTWVERNRVTQGDVMVGFFEAGVTAEAGTTYRVRVYETADGEVPLAEHDGIASGWQYTSAQQATDGVTESKVWFELVSVRDGIESWQQPRFLVALEAGWGYGWGLNWGGAS